MPKARSTDPMRQDPSTPPRPAAGLARPHAERAIAHSRARRRLALALLAAPLCAAAACGRSEASAGAVESELDRLVELATPLDPTLTSDFHDEHLHAFRAHIERLREADAELGKAALARYEATPDEEIFLVRRALLDVAAHAAPEESRPLLVELVTQYGYPLDARTEATTLLAETSPERALEVLRPLLEKTKRDSTMPDDEFLLKGYVIACERTGTSPVRLLVDVATNIYKQDVARHQAVRELGQVDDPLARQALRTVLIESTGNAYLRRIAAQSVRDSFPAEEACAIFEEVASREADLGFATFLADMIQENCY